MRFAAKPKRDRVQLASTCYETTASTNQEISGCHALDDLPFWRCARSAWLSLRALRKAQTEPFDIIGAGIAPNGIPVTPDDPVPHWAIGVATDLGLYYGQGLFQIDAFTSPTTADFSSTVPFVFTGSDGGQLVCYYGRVDEGESSPGVATLYPQADGKFVAVFVAEFTPVYAECTGRFSKLIGGSFIMVATTEPFVLGSTDPVAYWWEGQGTLTFQHAK